MAKMKTSKDEPSASPLLFEDLCSGAKIKCRKFCRLMNECLNCKQELLDSISPSSQLALYVKDHLNPQ